MNWTPQQVAAVQQVWNQIVAPAPGTVWKHRNGKLYEVLGVTNLALTPARQSEPGRDPMVVYRMLARAELFSRPLAQFEESFTQQVRHD